MNLFFKHDILLVGIKVIGETDEYITKIKFKGILQEIQREVKNNNNKLEFKSILTSLIRVFNTEDVFVSCSCLHPTTKIKLLDGTSPTVEEMKERFEAGEKLFVFSTDEKGDFKPGEVENVWITKTTNEFIKITLDNDEEILTTPDHLYMLRDGSYVMAEELTLDSSLMPMYTSESNGYTTVKLNSETRGWRSVYKIVADTLKKDEIETTKLRVKEDNIMPYDVAIHHRDFNKKNNHPDNLEIMTAEEHWNYHASLSFDKLPEETKEKIRKLSSERTSEIVEKTNLTKIKNIIQRIIDAEEIPSPETYKKYKTNGYPNFTKCFSTWKELSNYFNLNHKIIKIERIIVEDTPVYDISVKDYHNFVVDAGVVLHNCEDWQYRHAYWATQNNYNSGSPEIRVSDITNPNDTKGSGCKHIMLVLSNMDWIMKVCSVINNYIKYARQFMQRLYADYIFPQIYGIKYDKAVQLSLFDTDDFDSSPLTLDDANRLGRKSGQFKTGNPFRFKKKEEPIEDETNPLRLKFLNSTEDETSEEPVIINKSEQ
jgi:hypothetical protein